MIFDKKFIRPLLRDKDGSNAVEYALMMALVAVFIIAGVLAMSGAIGTLFNSVATCLNAPLNCSASTFNLSGSSEDDESGSNKNDGSGGSKNDDD